MGALMTTMGNKGRVVIPWEVRRQRGWEPGTALVLFETPTGITMMSAEEALTAFRRSVAGTDSPVDELIADRRREAAEDRAGVR